MRRNALLAAMAAVLALACTSNVLADGPKPLVVLSLSSHGDVADEIAPIGRVAETPDVPTWLSSMLKLFAEGQGVAGLDKSRPWGAVVQRDGGLSAFGFVPVSDVDALSWELDEYIQNTTDVGGGVYRVVGTKANQQLYATEYNGWLFVSDCPKTLATVPTDPSRLLGGLNRQYDVALRLELKNVPAKHGEKLLALLGKKLGPTITKLASEQTLEVIGRAAWELDQVTLGWSEHN